MSDADQANPSQSGRTLRGVRSGAWLGSSASTKRPLNSRQIGEKPLLSGCPRLLLVCQGLLALSVHFALWNVLILDQDAFARGKPVSRYEWPKPIEGYAQGIATIAMEGREMRFGGDFRDGDTKAGNGLFLFLDVMHDKTNNPGNNRSRHHKDGRGNGSGIAHLLYWPFVLLLMGLGFLAPWWIADKFCSVPNLHKHEIIKPNESVGKVVRVEVGEERP